MSSVKLILKESVHNLGEAGDVVKRLRLPVGQGMEWRDWARCGAPPPKSSPPKSSLVVAIV